MDVIAAMLLLVLALIGLCAAAIGWKVLLRDRRMRAKVRLRDLPRPAVAFVVVAVAAGVVGGLWLGMLAQDGRERHQRQQR